MLPVVGGEFARRRGRRSRIERGFVARKHSLGEELWRVRVDVELKVAVDESGVDAPTSSVDSIIDVDESHNAAHGQPFAESQRYSDDHAEETVSADRQREEFCIFTATAGDEFAASIHEYERLDIVNNRRHRQAATVGVCRERAAKCQRVGPSLLLRDSPAGIARGVAFTLQREVSSDQGRPLNARLDRDESPVVIECGDAIEKSHVNERFAREKLLSTHRVARSTN